MFRPREGAAELLLSTADLLAALQVLARVPNAILRAKFGAGSTLLCGVVEAKQVRSLNFGCMGKRSSGQAGSGWHVIPR